MAEANINVNLVPAFKPLLDATCALVAKWESMHSSYGHTDENVELAELLDGLADAVRGFRR